MTNMVKLRKDDFAVAWNEKDQEWRLFLPSGREDKLVPTEGVLLAAFMIRIQSDQEFADNMAKWVEENIE